MGNGRTTTLRNSEAYAAKMSEVEDHEATKVVIGQGPAWGGVHPPSRQVNQVEQSPTSDYTNQPVEGTGTISEAKAKTKDEIARNNEEEDERGKEGNIHRQQEHNTWKRVSRRKDRKEAII